MREPNMSLETLGTSLAIAGLLRETASGEPHLTDAAAYLYHDPRWEPVPTARGTRRDDTGETWIRWAVYNRADVEAYVARHSITLGDAAEDLSGFYGYDRGPGRPFCSGPSVQITRTRIVVRAHGGLDI